MRIARTLLAVCMLAAVAVTQPAAAADYTKLTDVRVPMSDGVVLTADVYVPGVPDADGDGLYPCVVELTPYRKESRYAEGASFLPAQGIALIEVDARGTGGSEGEYDIVFSVREQADAVEWIDWAATTATADGTPTGAKLCESTVGMYGGSYSGIIQYLVATLPATREGDVPAASPHLAAIAPQRAYGDLYRDIVYHGGMVIGSFGLIWSSGTTAYYTQPPADMPSDAARSAWADHLTGNDPMMVHYLANQYADATFASDDSAPQWTQRLYADSSALPRIENLRVPTLHLAGFHDSFTRGQLLTFQRAHELEQSLGARGPNFLIAGPWNHSGTHFITPDQGFRDELSDWYHYWLEGRDAGHATPAWIANGWDGAGARATWFQSRTGTINAQSPADGEWRTSASWPPEERRVKRLFLGGGGTLLHSGAGEGSSAYAYNPGAGKAEVLSRWDNAAGTPQPQLDQRLEGPGAGLSFETAVLETLPLAGPIALNLYASTVGAPGDPSLAGAWPGALQATPPYHDTDFVVKLSDVAPDGSVRLVSAGYLRASHRAVDDAKSLWVDGENLGPYHPHTLDALQPPAPGEPALYQIEIWPVAKTFEVGHRLRIDITSADTPNHIALAKPALNTIFHDAARPSYIAFTVAWPA